MRRYGWIVLTGIISGCVAGALDVDTLAVALVTLPWIVLAVAWSGR